jgi:hypothetical protein
MSQCVLRKWQAVIVFSIVLGLAGSGCGGDAPSDSTLVLPSGFTEASLPDVPLQVYVYVAQEAPLLMPVNVFEGQDISLDVDMPEPFQITELAAWADSHTEGFGWQARFVDTEQTTSIHEYLVRRDDPWHYWDNDRVTFVVGDSVWSQNAQQTVAVGMGTSLRDRYPDVWGLLQELPRSPPKALIAAGFMRLDGGLLQGFGEKGGINVGFAEQIFRVAGTKVFAFAVYGGTLPPLTSSVNADYFKGTGIAILAVTTSAYPSFLVSVGFDLLADMSGMEKIEVGEATAFYIAKGDLHIALCRRGSLLYLAFALTREHVEDLINSVPP